MKIEITLTWFVILVTIFSVIQFISLPENPRLSSLGMNGTRSKAEANHLYGPKAPAFRPGIGLLLQFGSNLN